MENDEWQERRTEPVNERDTMKNSRKPNVKSNTSDIEVKEKKEQQEQEKILAAKYLIELIRSVLEERKPQPKPEKVSMKQLFLTAKNNNLICMAYDALRQIAEPEDADIMKKWQKTSQSCTVMDVVQRSEGNKIFRAFTEQGEIRILPMKGWIIWKNIFILPVVEFVSYWIFLFLWKKKGRNCTEMSWKKNSGSEEKKTFLNSWKRQHFPGLEKNIMWVIREWRN